MSQRKQFAEFLKHIKSEALYGLERSHGGIRVVHCNAQRQLRLIVSAINQFNGIKDGHPIGWAERETLPQSHSELHDIAKKVCIGYGISFPAEPEPELPHTEGSIAWGLSEAYKLGLSAFEGDRSQGGSR